MSRILSLIIWSILTQPDAAGQSKWGVENYHYLDDPGAAAIVPVMHFETQKNLYAEFRYNYESAKTFTLLGGKTFSGGNTLNWSVIPMAGISAGAFNGASVACKSELEWKGFYFSFQVQQSVSFNKKKETFFVSWSESGYSITRHVFTGMALQYSVQGSKSEAEPGLITGISFRRFRFPVYLFNPLRSTRHVVLGMNYEWKSKKKN